MILQVSSLGHPEVPGADDLQRLEVAAPEGIDPERSLGELGRVDGHGQHAWLDGGAVRAHMVWS